MTIVRGAPVVDVAETVVCVSDNGQCNRQIHVIRLTHIRAGVKTGPAAEDVTIGKGVEIARFCLDRDLVNGDIGGHRDCERTDLQAQLERPGRHDVQPRTHTFGRRDRGVGGRLRVEVPIEIVRPERCAVRTGIRITGI